MQDQGKEHDVDGESRPWSMAGRLARSCSPTRPENTDQVSHLVGFKWESGRVERHAVERRMGFALTRVFETAKPSGMDVCVCVCTRACACVCMCMCIHQATLLIPYLGT